MANSFRWRKNGAGWNYVENATLPYNIAGIVATDVVDVDAIGPDTTIQAVLGPLTANFAPGASAGTVIAAITGLGTGETLTGVTPNDGRLAVTSSNLVVGLSASSAGNIAAVITTSFGRTLSMAITVGINPALLATIAKIRNSMATYNGANPVERADLATLPTFAYGTTHDSSLTVAASVGANPSQFLVSPGRKYIRNAGGGQNRLYVAGSNAYPSQGDLNGLGATAYTPNLPNVGEQSQSHQVGFVTSSPVIELQIPVQSNPTQTIDGVAGVATLCPYRLIVDEGSGWFYAPKAGFNPNVGTAGAVAGYTTVTFASAIPRKIILEVQPVAAGPLLNVSVQSSYAIAALPAFPLKALCLADSQVEDVTHGRYPDGTAPYRSFDSMASQFAAMVGAQLENAALGGTGIVKRGSTDTSINGSLGNRNNMLQMLDYVLADAMWDYINIYMSQNDGNVFIGDTNNGTTYLKTNFLAMIAKIRATQPQAVIFVHGYYWANNGGIAAANMEVALNAAANALNDPGIVLIERQTKAGGPPITGTGHAFATTGDGNADTMISGDGTHVTNAGQTLLAASDVAIARTKIPALATSLGV